jgi:tubulin polyglutamylase TTLL6/13
MNDSVKINVANTQYEVVSELANEFNYEIVSESEYSNSDIIWQDNAITPDQLSELSSTQRINHFPGMFIIARKDFLGKNLKSMRSIFPKTFNFFPPTWILPRDFPDLKSQFNEKRAKTFICKPEALSQGKGIFLTRSLEEIPEKCVVQRYLHRPFLLDGLKFDLRVYVLITSSDPLRLYLHKEGLVRLATEPYSNPVPSNLSNICMHLTNYAINKNSSKFEFNQDAANNFSGHKRSLSVFMQKLKELGHDSEALWKDIGEIVVKTLCVAQPTLSHLYRSSQPNDLTGSICFQVLGFDVFLNDRLKPILLEVNHTPSFTTDTPLDLLIKKAVIGDALKMLGIGKNLDIDLKINRGARGIKEIRIVKNEIREKWNLAKGKMEEENKGGYSRIFPNEMMQEFEEYAATARDLWLTNVGIRKKKSRENSLVAVKVLPNVSPTKHLNSFTPVQGNVTPAQNTNRKSRAETYKGKKVSRSIKVFDLQNKIPQKLPAIKLAFGCYLQPRIFDFSDSKQIIVLNKEEKQG